MESLKNTVLAFLIGLLCFATNAISSENGIILNQNRHTGISETYTHDDIKRSVFAEANRIDGLSQVLSIKEVRPDYEFLAGVVRNAARAGTQSFKSFSAFKRALGPAGSGKAWHHIVEQNPANIAKFGVESIHTTGNLIKLPHGAGLIHAKISGHYSSIQRFTGGKTVRQWLNTKSFEFQRNYGLQKLKEFGWAP